MKPNKKFKATRLTDESIDVAIKRLSEATGKSEAAIRNTLFDIKAKAWARHKTIVSDTDALEALGNVLAFAGAAEELSSLSGPPVVASASHEDQHQGPRGSRRT